MLELTVVRDTEPEEDELYTVILSQPDGGATLGQITQKRVIIEANDAPYGLLEIYPAGTRSVVHLSICLSISLSLSLSFALHWKNK